MCFEAQSSLAKALSDMAKAPNDKDEDQLARLTKSLLAMPTKPRDDTKFAKKKAKKKPAKKRA